ncbi:MAG: GNAT family N-acetyltransferase [Ruminococcus sp.]|nr:GNAT family N-acetyltransferase [Ruminococcus sp.]
MVCDLNTEIVPYENKYYTQLIEFLKKCLPQSGRALDIDGRHSFYKDIQHNFKGFYCMLHGEKIIGTVAVHHLSEKDCELKSLYLLQEYHGRGYGRKLLNTAVSLAKKLGYAKMYLDSLSTSTRAIALYKKSEFVDTEKYNDSIRSDVFMVLELNTSQ